MNAEVQHGHGSTPASGIGPRSRRGFPRHCSLTDDRFYEFCRLNRELRIERTAAGELFIMSARREEIPS